MKAKTGRMSNTEEIQDHENKTFGSREDIARRSKHWQKHKHENYVMTDNPRMVIEMTVKNHVDIGSDHSMLMAALRK